MMGPYEERLRVPSSQLYEVVIFHTEGSPEIHRVYMSIIQKGSLLSYLDSLHLARLIAGYTIVEAGQTIFYEAMRVDLKERWQDELEAVQASWRETDTETVT